MNGEIWPREAASSIVDLEICSPNAFDVLDSATDLLGRE
jgi:hypothetical protein